MGRYFRRRYVVWLIRYAVWLSFGALLVWMMDGPWPEWGTLAAVMWAAVMAELGDNE